MVANFKNFGNGKTFIINYSVTGLTILMSRSRHNFCKKKKDKYLWNKQMKNKMQVGNR